MKNFKHLIKSTFECLKLIKRIQDIRSIKNFKVYNICGAVSANPIDLISLAETFPGLASYETKLFPAVKFRFENKIFTVHRSGKIFSTGFKSIDQIKLSFSKFLKFIDIDGGTEKEKAISLEN